MQLLLCLRANLLQAVSVKQKYLFGPGIYTKKKERIQEFRDIRIFAFLIAH